jgi:hypothetical protein
LPRKEDIEKFKEVLNSLGGEPEIMARRSEAIEDVQPPEDALPAGLEEPLGGAGEPPGESPLAPAQEAAEGGPDFGLDLSSLEDLDTGSEPPGAPAQPETEGGEPAPTDESGLDFGSLFGEESSTPSIEDLEPPPAGPTEAGTAAAGESAAEEFALPDSESSSLQSDLSQMEVLPEDIGEPALPSEEAPLMEPAPEKAPSQEAPSEEVLAGIELPNLEDLSLTEPLEGVAVEEAAPALEAEAGLPASREPGEPSGGESAEIPSLEDFDFGPGPQIAEEAPAPSIPEPEEPAAPTAPGEAAEEGLRNLNLEDFSFTEPTGQFATAAQPEAETVTPPKPSARPEQAIPIPELGGVGPEIALTPEQFNRLKRTLESLPRNLKLAVQQVIGEGHATGAALTRLVSLLVAGATAQQIAGVVARITGKRIVIPAGYEKRSGVAFEIEQRSFAYALRENIYPIVRLFALTVLAAAIVGFIGYRLVYRPLYALANYRIGYSHILGDRFTLANERFERARAAQRIKGWYYRYAEAFADKRQYILAEQKYDLLLQDFPGDRKGVLDYARMESARLADYKKADDLLKIILDKDQYDFDALLAAGDNNLEWAAAENDPKDSEHYKASRVDYASLIERYGARDELLFRMLRWFIRTDNPQEIERLRSYFASRPELRVDPGVYAELGGYLIDHRQLDYAKDVLLKADEADPRLAEIHYNLARYYRLTQLPDDELTALEATLLRLRPSDPLTPKRIAIEIDTHTRRGELYDAKGQYIDGERELAISIAKVEESQKSKLITTGGIFGRPYADLGDLHYYIIGDLDTARDLYQKAIDNQYFDPSLDYKIGFTQYAAKDYAAALTSFSKAEEEWGYPRDRDAPPPFVPTGTGPVDYSGKAPSNLLFAIGNCFYQRGDYFAAQGYYLRLRDRLEDSRAALGPLFPEEKPEHRSLLESLVKVDNNLGVVMDRLAARTGDRRKRSEGLVYLTDASQIADTLTTGAPGSLSTGGARTLPFLNQRGILYPVSGFVPQISSDIPRDLGTLSW